MSDLIQKQESISYDKLYRPTRNGLAVCGCSSRRVCSETSVASPGPGLRNDCAGVGQDRGGATTPDRSLAARRLRLHGSLSAKVKAPKLFR